MQLDARCQDEGSASAHVLPDDNCDFRGDGGLRVYCAGGERPRSAQEAIRPAPIVYTELPNVCARCHKSDGRGGPAYGELTADLRATELDHEGLVQIVTEGLRDKGMPEFKTVLTKREIDGVATYIVERIKGVYLDDAGNRITRRGSCRLEAERGSKGVGRSHSASRRRASAICSGVILASKRRSQGTKYSSPSAMAALSQRWAST